MQLSGVTYKTKEDDCFRDKATKVQTVKITMNVSLEMHMPYSYYLNTKM